VSGEIAQLVDAARDGDRAAFAELYRRYARFVHGIVLARVARVDVDDIVQDVFLTAMERLRSLTTAEAFGGWLAAIARNHATTHLRKNLHRCVELHESAVVSVNDHRAEGLAALAAIRALPEAYRETLMLRLVEGMTGPEIARCTGLTDGSVRVNLHRGMKLLRERLGRS
jgi:RNA polymerase sigma-70 factor (ECF subfamily)